MNRHGICLEEKKNQVNCAETAGRQNWHILTCSQQSVKEKTDSLRRLRNVWCCMGNDLNLCRVKFVGWVAQSV